MSDSSQDLKNTEAELRKQFETLKSQLGISIPESSEPPKEEEKQEKPAEQPQEESAAVEKKEEEKKEEKPTEQSQEEEKEKEEEEEKQEEEPKIDNDVTKKEGEETVKEDSKPTDTTASEQEPTITTTEKTEMEPAVVNPTPVSQEQDKENEQEVVFARVVKPFVNESFIIDDYDHHDAKKPLVQVVRTRVDGNREYSPPLIGGDECDALMVRSNALKMEEEAGIPTVLPREMYSSKPPKNWKPVVDGFHIFDLPKGKPEDQGNLCYECKNPIPAGKGRLCSYTCKYFCSKCFPASKKYYVPSNVVLHWDFEQYAVNPRSFDYLCSIMTVPMIDISLAHPQLYNRVPVMKDLNMMRRKLFYMKDFILSCTRLKEDDPAKKSLVACKPYYYTNVDIFSFEDLIHSERLLESLMDILEAWLTHIASCQLCGAKGSYCEICGKNERIFPFQLLEVSQCPECKGIFHRACLKKNNCPKCKRVNKRH